MKNSQNEKRKEKDKDKDKDKEYFKIPQLPYNFNISDTIVKYIIEKIISLTISQSLKNKVERQINSFCFEEIQNSLFLALCVDFINYDKDDITHKKNLLDFKSKSFQEIEEEEKDEYNFIQNKSEIIRKYKFSSGLDANVSYEGSINLEVFKTPKKEKEKDNNFDFEKNSGRKFFMRYLKEEKKDEKKQAKKDPNLGKLLNGLIIRENYKNNEKKNDPNDYLLNNALNKKDSFNKSIKEEDKEPFMDDIEKIHKLESHKLDFNPQFINAKEENLLLFCDPIKTNKNSWNNIQQPKVPPIDRDAGTKINFIKNIFKTKKSKAISNPQEDSTKRTSQTKNEFTSSIKSFKKQKSKKFSFSPKNKLESEDNNPRKKKYAPIIEFPSYDIDPKVLGGDNENQELKKLRENLEKELIEKKLEQSRKLQKEREIQAFEKALEEKRKELARKNVTVDIKGDIVYIKSLNVNDFINDFTRMKSRQKDIKLIQSVSKNTLIQKATVEKNPLNIFEQFEKEKTKKKAKKNNPKSPRKDERQRGENNISRNLGLMDRIREPIIAAGSNFEIMNPEIGVTLKEDEKTKVGGKDFYQKYNKYSIEVFQETLNRTLSSNFYSMQGNSFFNTNISGTNTNTTINKSLKRLLTKKIKEEKIEEKTNNEDKKNINKNNINLMIPNEANDRLFVKAKNLKMALNKLDLITEKEEKYFSAKKNNKNIIKNNKIMDEYFNKNKNNYDEINKFAKTLVGSDKWGDNLLHTKKPGVHFKLPQKPLDIELKREVPLNLLNHMPRNRLPPINMTYRLNNELSMGMGYTMTEGFFRRKKKMRAILSEDNSKKETDKNKKDNKDRNSINLKNQEKEYNKDKFSYTSTSGFFQKQSEE